MLFGSSQWSSDNKSPQNLDSDHDSDSSEERLKESGSESNMDKDGLLEVWFCSCNEKESDGEIDEGDLTTVYVGIDQADIPCVKLNKLIKTGKIQKDRIFYKFMNDVVQEMYDLFHPYDREVIDFFNTITYLGGKATTCFIRGPMNFGNGKDSAHLITKHHQNDLQKSVKFMTFQMSLLVLIIGKVHIRSHIQELSGVWAFNLIDVLTGIIESATHIIGI